MRCAAHVWECWLLLLSGKGEIKPGYGDRRFSASDLAWGYEFACDALKQILLLVVVNCDLGIMGFGYVYCFRRRVGSLSWAVYLAGAGLLSFLPVYRQRRVRPCRYYFIWFLRVQTGYEVMHIIIESGVPGSVPPADTPVTVYYDPRDH